MKTDVANRFIWFKGEIVNVNDAKINVLAPTSQFGLNVFEGIPCYWNEDKKELYAFRLDEHYNRLLRSAKLIQLDCPYTKADFKKAFIENEEKLTVLEECDDAFLKYHEDLNTLNYKYVLRNIEMFT